MNDVAFIVIGYALGIFITFWILFEIIRSATKSAKNIKLQEKQVRLLTKLLEKQGATTEEIDILLMDK